MKKIITHNYKIAANYDDQPNFHKPRDRKEQGGVLYGDPWGDTADDIKKMWDNDEDKKDVLKKKKRRKKRKSR